MFPLYQIVTNGYGLIQAIAGEAEVLFEQTAKTEEENTLAMDRCLAAITDHMRQFA